MYLTCSNSTSLLWHQTSGSHNQDSFFGMATGIQNTTSINLLFNTEKCCEIDLEKVLCYSSFGPPEDLHLPEDGLHQNCLQILVHTLF